MSRADAAGMYGRSIDRRGTHRERHRHSVHHPDGIVSDPDGTGGTKTGGWAFRHGPETVAGDKFRLGSALDDGVMLLGRTTWQLYSRLWPERDDPFSMRMNAVPKLVASRTLTDTSAWANSRVIDGDVVDVVKRERRDMIITGSRSVVHSLMAEDLVDDYRLLTFPCRVRSQRARRSGRSRAEE